MYEPNIKEGFQNPRRAELRRMMKLILEAWSNYHGKIQTMKQELDELMSKAQSENKNRMVAPKNVAKRPLFYEIKEAEK